MDIKTNTAGFLKKFCSRSHHLLLVGVSIGYPYDASEVALSELSNAELVELAKDHTATLKSLQDYAALESVVSQFSNSKAATLVKDIRKLLHCAGRGSF